MKAILLMAALLLLIPIAFIEDQRIVLVMVTISLGLALFCSFDRAMKHH